MAWKGGWAMGETLTKLAAAVWGGPLMGLLLAVGAVYTIRLRGVQFRFLGEGFRCAFREDPEAEGDASPFQALCTALAATIGTGNIVGVAAALVTGGPGALFWMILAALLGMATQYAEGCLAVRHRYRDSRGRLLGGPFAYMERGLGWRLPAKAYAACAVIAGVCGIGTVAQAGAVTEALTSFFAPTFDGRSGIFLLGAYRPAAAVVGGILLAAAAAAVMAGGVRRIARAAEALVPVMAVGYTAVNILLLLWNLPAVPAAVGEILRGAFDPAAVTGGAVGSVVIAARQGLARGIFTNEAGMGTAAIAAASARTSSPERQGMAAMVGTFVDTVVLCTLTGLSIVVTGAWRSGGGGAGVTARAFVRGLPLPEGMARLLLAASLVIFAFAAILGWHFYTQQCLGYLTGGSRLASILCRGLCVAALIAAPYVPGETVWALADVFNGLMAYPNLVALLILAPEVRPPE